VIELFLTVVGWITAYVAGASVTGLIYTQVFGASVDEKFYYYPCCLFWPIGLPVLLVVVPLVSINRLERGWASRAITDVITKRRELVDKSRKLSAALEQVDTLEQKFRELEARRTDNKHEQKPITPSA
jgi:hypothetical protein